MTNLCTHTCSIFYCLLNSMSNNACLFQRDSIPPPFFFFPKFEIIYFKLYLFPTEMFKQNWVYSPGWKSPLHSCWRYLPFKYGFASIHISYPSPHIFCHSTHSLLPLVFLHFHKSSVLLCIPLYQWPIASVKHSLHVLHQIVFQHLAQDSSVRFHQHSSWTMTHCTLLKTKSNLFLLSNIFIGHAHVPCPMPTLLWELATRHLFNVLISHYMFSLEDSWMGAKLFLHGIHLPTCTLSCTPILSLSGMHMITFHYWQTFWKFGSSI